MITGASDKQVKNGADKRKPYPPLVKRQGPLSDGKDKNDVPKRSC